MKSSLLLLILALLAGFLSAERSLKAIRKQALKAAKAGRYAKAVKLFEEGLHLHPNDRGAAKLWHNYGVTLWRKTEEELGDAYTPDRERGLDAALGCFERALELEPDHAAAIDARKTITADIDALRVAAAADTKNTCLSGQDGSYDEKPNACADRRPLVMRAANALTEEELDRILDLEKQMWKSGPGPLVNSTRNFGEEAGAYTSHGHSVTYLHNLLRKQARDIHDKLQATALRLADEAGWGIREAGMKKLRPRCVESIRYRSGKEKGDSSGSSGGSVSKALQDDESLGM